MRTAGRVARMGATVTRGCGRSGVRAPNGPIGGGARGAAAGDVAPVRRGIPLAISRKSGGEDAVAPSERRRQVEPFGALGARAAGGRPEAFDDLDRFRLG